MAGRAIRRDTRRDHRSRLPAGLGTATTALAAALRSPSRGGVSGWADDVTACDRVTGRRALPQVAVGPHGAAPAPHGGRPTHAVDGRPGGSAARRLAPLDPGDGPGTDEGSDRPQPDAMVAPSRRGLDRVRTQLVGLARASALRPRPRLRPLASRRALLLPRERAAVLATRGPRMAGTVDLAALDNDSVSGPRDVPERAAGRDPHVFRSRDLYQIFVCRRPGTRRCHHVGARFDPAPAADPPGDSRAIIRAGRDRGAPCLIRRRAS